MDRSTKGLVGVGKWDSLMKILILTLLHERIIFALSIRQYQIHTGDSIRNIFKNYMEANKQVHSVEILIKMN